MSIGLACEFRSNFRSRKIDVIVPGNGADQLKGLGVRIVVKEVKQCPALLSGCKTVTGQTRIVV